MIIQTQTTSFKKELYEGIHDLTTDTIRIALYAATANLSDTTTQYTADGEITGAGYTAGGEVLTGATVSSAGKTAYVSFDNAIWSAASFTCRGALIYNASKANRSIAVLNFGADKTVSNQEFSVIFPANDPNSAIIRTS